MTLHGAEADVEREGILFVKQRFTITKKPKHVVLRGSTLTVYDVDQRADRTARTMLLEGASLQSQRQSLRLVLVLATKEKITLYSNSKSDFELWFLAFTDAIQWNIERFYELQQKIGAGSFSVVRRAFCRKTEEVVAVKEIDKSSCSEEDMVYLQREIDITRSLKHHLVVGTKDCFETDESLYIVMEYIPGGTLDDIVRHFGKLSETNSKSIIEQVLQGLKFVHSQDVVHRDIKPENIMCTRRSLPTVVKLTDFGLARCVRNVSERGVDVRGDALGPDGLMTTPVGTPNFVAPEILHGLPYGKEVDLFAVGVVMYYTLAGYYPFDNADPEIMIEQIKRSDYSFPSNDWDLISPEAKSLINGLLDRSPFSRLSADQALSHKWIAGLVRSTSEIHDSPSRSPLASRDEDNQGLRPGQLKLNMTKSDIQDSPRGLFARERW